VIDDDALLASVRSLGARLTDGLLRLPGVESVRGRGLMIAAELSRDDAPDLARRALLEQRLILNATGPSTLRFLPPLIVSPPEIDDALGRLGALLA
jgi:acetylornithine/N-succinyldiaminopimelate aminotransferase